MQLTCPDCSSILQEQEQQLICQNCDRIWALTDGIARFVENAYYWGELPQELMRKVNTHAKAHGWISALNTYVKDDYANIYNYVTDANRADFTYFIPLTQDSVVLDVGSGWGTIPYLLALRHKHVVSLESVEERITFQRIRAEQEGLDNLQLIQASFLRMPLAENSFDLAILNGVLEWIGIASEVKSPRELQLNVLRKLWSSLKPGGWLYVGIENRFGYDYFLGGPDHSGVPYTSLMPRSMANMVMSRKSGNTWRTKQRIDAYRTYTYSYWGYKKLLQEAGFDNVQVNLVFPDYNHPAYIIPATDKKVFRYIVQQLYSGQTAKRKLLRTAATLTAPLGLQRVFSLCFSIFAQKL
ncbi:MAG: class I SAM-dependent methyltransferase [Chloroflexi bacterium]|nr:class I SAM-dependent methyltransferase [Chloroflexota bacterium]